MCLRLIWIKIHIAKIWCHHSWRKRTYLLWNFALSLWTNEWCFWKLCGLKAIRIWHKSITSYFSWITIRKRTKINIINVRMQSSPEGIRSYIITIVKDFSFWIERFSIRLHSWLKWKSRYTKMYWENASRNYRLYCLAYYQPHI